MPRRRLPAKIPAHFNFVDVGFGEGERLRSLSAPRRGKKPRALLGIDRVIPPKVRTGLKRRKGVYLSRFGADAALKELPANSVSVVNSDIALAVSSILPRRTSRANARAFRQVFRVLRPGGRFYVSIPFAYLEATAESLARQGFWIQRLKTLGPAEMRTIWERESFRQEHERLVFHPQGLLDLVLNGPQLAPVRLIALKPVPGRRNPDFKSDPNFKSGAGKR